MPFLTDPSIPTIIDPRFDDLTYVVDASAPPGTGSRTITYQNYLKRNDVRMYGAFGDGFIDDKAAIQAAISAAEAAGDGEVYFSRGTYMLGSGIIVTKSNVPLNGAGRDITKIKTLPAFTTGEAIAFRSMILPLNSSPQDQAGLSNMSIISGTPSDVNTQTGLWIEDFHTSRFENLSIREFNRGIRCGCYMNIFDNVRVEGTRNLADLGQIGWEFYGTLGTGPFPAQTTLIHCSSYYYQTGLYLTECNTIQAFAWDVQRCTLGAFIGKNVHNVILDGYWESLETFVTIAGSGSLQNELAMNITISGFWNPLQSIYGFIDTVVFATLQYCRNVTFRNIHVRNSYLVAGDKFTVGAGVEDISIENCNEIFDQLMAPNYVTSINGPLSRGNLVINGNFERWSLGPAAVPDGWLLYGAATVGQITGDPRYGPYVAEITGPAATDFLWNIIPIPEAFQKPGVTVTLVYDTQIRDSTKALIGLYPTNSSGVLKGTASERTISNEIPSYPIVPANTWITRASRPAIIGAGATQLRVHFYPDRNGAGKKARLARVGVYFGSTGWAYEESAFDTRAPAHIDVTEQTYSAAGTSTTELGTWVLPIKTLRQGYGLRIRAAGKMVGVNGAKIVGLKIDATSIAHIDFLAAETDPWYLEVTGFRRAANVLACFIKTQKGTLLIDAPYAAITTPDLESADVTISVYGTLASAFDRIEKEMFIVDLI